MKYLLLLAFTISFAAEAVSSHAQYIPFVKPIEQRVIDDPRGGNKKRFEGCGPVAAAMLFSYWEGEKNFKIMSEPQIFNGSYHPSQTIKEFYTASWSQKAPAKAKAPDGKKYNQTFTLPNSLVSGLNKFVLKANLNNAEKLRVNRYKARNSTVNKLKVLRKQLSLKNPVISLIHNIPACLNSKDNKSGGWHYVVVVGMNMVDQTVDILSGWKELDARSSTGSDVHQRRNHPDSNKAHVKCSLDEFTRANPAFYWIEESDS